MPSSVCFAAAQNPSVTSRYATAVTCHSPQSLCKAWQSYFSSSTCTMFKLHIAPTAMSLPTNTVLDVHYRVSSALYPEIQPDKVPCHSKSAKITPAVTSWVVSYCPVSSTTVVYRTVKQIVKKRYILDLQEWRLVPQYRLALLMNGHTGSAQLDDHRSCELLSLLLTGCINHKSYMRKLLKVGIEGKKSAVLRSLVTSLQCPRGCRTRKCFGTDSVLRVHQY